MSDHITPHAHGVHEPHGAGHAHPGHHEHGHHDAHRVNYLYVFLALCVFTVISWAADEMKFIPHRVTIVLVLAVATAKALCVMLFFMHLLFERNWKYVLLAPTIILAIGIPLALLPDIGLHYYTEDVPQMRIPNPVHGEEHAPVEHAPGEHDPKAEAPATGH